MTQVKCYFKQRMSGVMEQEPDVVCRLCFNDNNGCVLFDTNQSEPPLHTFDSGAVRYPTGRRYDLMSPIAVWYYIPQSMQRLVYYLLTFHNKPCDSLRDKKRACTDLIIIMRETLALDGEKILDLYAQALDEGAEKYGDRNWEKGIPESNLINHAIAHAVKIAWNDTSENHVAHLIWNVFAIIHFRLKEHADKLINGET